MKNFDVIRLMYPDAAFSMVDDDISTIAWRTEGIATPTQEEIDAEINRLAEAKTEAITAKADAKATAMSKLQALGLTSEEIAAITNN